MKKIDLTGKKFGRLTVVKEFGKTKSGKIIWKCLCACGGIHCVDGWCLRSGGSKSCGCLQGELTSKRSSTHRMSKTSLYWTYCHIKNRCENPDDTGFQLYGGRGIKCLWRSFEEFLDDMLERYRLHVAEFGERNTTVDRIDNNGNYCKENCRWATAKEQARNKRNNHLLTYSEETHCIAEWAEKLKLTYSCLYLRIYKGWPIEKALTTPVRTI